LIALISAIKKRLAALTKREATVREGSIKRMHIVNGRASEPGVSRTKREPSAACFVTREVLICPVLVSNSTDFKRG
jgi:hypothetical protein